MLSSRPATEADAKLIVEVIDAAELALNPSAQPVGVGNVLDQLRGHFAEPIAQLVYQSGRTKPVAVFLVQVDPSRKRLYPDIYVLPGKEIHAQVEQMMLEVAAARFSGWQLWQGINAKDKTIKQVLRKLGFELLRRYWSMERSIKHSAAPVLASDLTIKVVRTESEFRLCHQVQQSSFASHFGFVPRSFEEWYRLTTEAEGYDPDGVAVLFKLNVPIGFVECNNDNAHFNSGYINGIGVIPSEQGKGFGELLLRWAIAHSADLGYSRIELNVDAGNESGALRLYEKTGFKPYLAWEQWHKPNWSAESSAQA